MRIGLRLKVLLAFFLMSLVVFSLSGVLMYAKYRDNINQKTEADMKSAMIGYKESFDNIIRNIQRYGNYMRYSRSVSRMLNSSGDDDLERNGLLLIS